MHQYLLGHVYWSYVDGANDAAPESTHKVFPAWEQAASRVLYCFASFVIDQLMSYIQDARTPMDTCRNLKKIFCEHHSQKAPTQANVEQSAATRYVGD